MPNHKKSLRAVVLPVAISLAMMLATGRCLGDNGDITAQLQPNLDVGVAFPPSMGPSPQYSPQGGFFDVTVTLDAPSDYLIIASATQATDQDGGTVWKCTSGTTGSVGSQTWEGTGEPSLDSWSDVYFSGQLTTTGSGDGSPPPFWASVADISVYVDAMGLHSDEPSTHHWPPVIGHAEHDAETSEGGGFYVPPAIVTTGTGDFPSSLLPTGSNYKTIILRLKTPEWTGDPSPDGNVGSLTFGPPTGVAIYDLSTGSLVTGAIRVPPGGFPNKQFALLTDENFTATGCITAIFIWDEDLAGGPPAAQDFAAIGARDIYFRGDRRPGVRAQQHTGVDNGPDDARSHDA